MLKKSYVIIGIFAVAMFGLTSALISFLRSLLFHLAAVIILPLVFGIDGIWFSVVAGMETKHHTFFSCLEGILFI